MQSRTVDLFGPRVFSNFVFDFRYLSTIMMAFFRIFLSNAFYGFCDFAKEVTTSSRAKAAKEVTPSSRAKAAKEVKE